MGFKWNPASDTASFSGKKQLFRTSSLRVGSQPELAAAASDESAVKQIDWHASIGLGNAWGLSQFAGRVSKKGVSKSKSL